MVRGLNHGGRELWSLHIPPRVKLFIWRCLQNTLPTRDNLARRGVKDFDRDRKLEEL
ncbi:hypothetical protein Leryth_010065 [Lithospermum erythrorhizon]|nr:hypothetical protein Leryth_010065 [Lithospermum erythrorhizon]